MKRKILKKPKFHRWNLNKNYTHKKHTQISLCVRSLDRLAQNSRTKKVYTMYETIFVVIQPAKLSLYYFSLISPPKQKNNVLTIFL